MAQQTACPPTRSGRPLLDFAGAAEYTGLTERYIRRLVAEDENLPSQARQKPHQSDPL